MFNMFINNANYKRIVFLTFPLYEISNPNMVINLLCHFFGNALVSTSTTMSSVEQYSNMTLSFSIRFQTKWCYTLMCFVWACWVQLFVNDIAPWLSHWITIAFFSFMYPNSLMSFVIYMVSLVACVLAMYAASVSDCGLSFATPRNGSTSHHEYKHCGGSPIFKVINPIHITIFDQILGW
jgi:hypothetical protein